MNCYQKFYTNQIHSSSLLCQLATMWKSQILCDAVIRTGAVITKAHRVVLVAACPMLQSMDNASMGSHLEVRLASDIKQDSINTFLQYLYEGFMMLTEENCKDVEKIARLLQVDSVIKCCADFQKCLNAATGTPVSMDSQYKYTSYDMLEFRHVRSSGLQKSVNMKRMSNYPGPSSPGSKRQRMGRPSSPHIDSHSSSHRADDTLSMAHSYRQNQPDPWDRVPRLGASNSRAAPQPGVIDIVEDCLEIIQTEEPEKDARGIVKPDSRPKQKSVSIGVSSQMNTTSDVHVVNISDPGGSVGPPKQGTMNGSRGSITVNPLTMFNDPSTSSQVSARPADCSNDVQVTESESARKENFVHAMTPPQQPVFPTMTPISRSTSKPFAAGSATQVPTAESGAKNQGENDAEDTQDQGNRVDLSEELSSSSSVEKAPDISIVKVEGHTGGLDMYVDMPDEAVMSMKAGIEDSIENEEESDPEHDQSQDMLREDMSNEASNVSGDQNNSWYIGQFKGQESRPKNMDQRELVAQQKIHTDANSHLNIPDFNRQTSHHSLAKARCDPFLSNTGFMSSKCSFSSEVSFPNSSEISSQCLNTTIFSDCIHKLIRLGGKQRPCALCKHFCKKTPCGDNIRTYYKCEKCDVPLCKGPIRNCFKEFHEHLGTTREYVVLENTTHTK
uniref:Uncharacterized protein LOC111118864 isoform X2 n=1 Tax=Crassostrea virginica TaxID=6565 RepID=A0A8B8CEQ7_CRAVI|nr:uncharacterized protein LOC111118864 isoform X2 [Crassostrea virginica]